MQATHTSSIDIVVLGSLADTVIELLHNPVAVREVIPLSVHSSIPLSRSCIVDQKRFAVACRYHYSPFVCHDLTFWVAVEGACTCVHCRSKHVCLEPEHEFAYLVVRLRA